MTGPNTNRGPWTHRCLIYLFTAVFTVLIFWLLGFVIDDIGSWSGPSYDELEKRLLDQQVVARAEELQSQIDEVKRTVQQQQKRQRLLQDSTNNSQQTMNQLLDIQRLSLTKDVKPSPEEQQALAESQQLFLSNQKQYQALNEEITRLEERLRGLEESHRATQDLLEEKREPVRREYQAQRDRHDLKMAALKLSLLTPLLILVAVLLLKNRRSTYVWLIYGSGIAVALKVTMVMHEHFPSRYFKYVLILVTLAAVVRILVYLLSMVASPKTAWLLKQYREAYESFFCPVCGYPIRRGPLKFMAWTCRSLRKVSAPVPTVAEAEKPYCCPACTTRLYEECATCGEIRPSLLPACESCGTVKPLRAEDHCAAPSASAVTPGNPPDGMTP
ncbi:MAG: hypothetical protein HQ567_13755 [Candidatus Nealsonbacteria bacterium]|nr:hypothetical protein [Candidatus Nealsonbacteria bacterium]